MGHHSLAPCLDSRGARGSSHPGDMLCKSSRPKADGDVGHPYCRLEYSATLRNVLGPVEERRNGHKRVYVGFANTFPRYVEEIDEIMWTVLVIDGM